MPKKKSMKNNILFLIPIIFISCLMYPQQSPWSLKRVLISSPVRQKPAILREFLQSLEELVAVTFIPHFCFIDDNIDAESMQLLIEFCQRHNPYASMGKAPEINDDYLCNEHTHYWNERIIWKVAGFKDSIFDYALQQRYDYVFLVDSDIVLHSNTIEQLITAEKDIVSEVFWTQWTPDMPKAPQVWLYDTYTQYEIGMGEKITKEEAIKRFNRFLSQLLQPGVYEVGGLGACTLISKKALEKGVNFKKVKNISFWGEDRHFCIRAAALGIPLWVDTHHPAYHIYRESDLVGVAQFKENCKNGVYQI